MKEDNRFSKPVAFNRSKEIDKKILKHVARRNFSGYVKKLILADIEATESKNAKKSSETPPEIPAFSERREEIRPNQTTEPKTAADRLTEMKAKKKKTGNNAGPKLFH